MSTIEEPYSNYRFIFYTILGPIVSCLGIVGNLLCLSAICYGNCKKNSSQQTKAGTLQNHMYTFLCGLACSDLFYLTFNLQACYFMASVERLEDYSSYLVYVQSPTWNAFKATSDLIVILMTIDRCKMIGNIAKVQLQVLRDQSKQTSVYWQISTALIFSFMMHMPYYFNVESSVNLYPNQTSYGNNTSLHELWIVYETFYVVMIKILPVLIVVALNICLIMRLKVVWNRRKRLLQSHPTVTTTDVENVTENRRKAWSVTSKQSMKEQKLAFLLLSITTSFVVFTLPANIAYIFSVYTRNSRYGEIWRDDGNLTPLYIITNFLESVNYCINFYIYCVVHKEIRESFIQLCKALFCCCF